VPPDMAREGCVEVGAIAHRDPPTAQEVTRPLLAMARRAGLPEGHPGGAVAPGSRWPLNVVGKRDGKRRNAWPRRRRPRTPATISRGT
jgi:hypothetical protein